MTDAAAIVAKLPGAGEASSERELIGELRDALRSSTGSVLQVTAGLRDGTSVNLMQASAPADVQSLTITVKDGSGEKTVGPFKPQDTNAYFDLFLE